MSVRAFATGSTLSGKTFRLRSLFAERMPRCLVLDPIGNPQDWMAWPGVQVVDSLRGVSKALADNASRGQWRILWLTELSSPAVDQIAQLMLPESPLGFSYSAAVGGVAIVCDEVAELMPNKGGDRSDRMGMLWRRGRHRGLSMLTATQRIADVHRTVTAQSRYFVCCPQHEPRDLDTLSLRMPPHVLEIAKHLQPRHCVVWDAERFSGGLVDPAGQVIQALSRDP